jgi:thiol-disulfide isomerase/thioredoxin
MALKEIKPNSQLWSSNPNLLTIALVKTKQNINNSLYVISAMKNNDDPNVKSELLGCQYEDAENKKDENSARQLASRILKEFPQTNTAKIIKDKYYGIIPGKIIPEYQIPSLTKNGETISKKSMLGKIYLIDFWATWCGPCLSEMPYLHDAYIKYSSKGLEILSIAFDQKDNVEKFRSEKWRLPWLNSVVEDGFSSQIAKSFSISGIPKPILVSKDGKIIAVDEELRGDKLNKTLEKYIN